MSSIAQSKFVIMGKPRNRPGQKGLVSTLSAEHDILLRSGDRDRLMDLLKSKVSLALGAWQRAKPDWSFVLKEVPQQRDYPVYSAYLNALDALYD